MLRLRKVTLGQLKIEIFFVTLETLNYLELFVLKFDSTSSWFEKKIFSEGIFDEKNERGDKNAPCKIRLKPKRDGLKNKLTIIMRCRFFSE